MVATETTYDPKKPMEVRCPRSEATKVSSGPRRQGVEMMV